MNSVIETQIMHAYYLWNFKYCLNTSENVNGI